MPEKSKTKSAGQGPFLSEDSTTCLEHFSAIVANLPVNELEKFNADPNLVRKNVQRGVDAVQPHLDHVHKALPLLDTKRILELPSLILALAFHYNNMVVVADPNEVAERQARLRPVRRWTLTFLEIMAEMGKIPSKPIENIRADSGPVDEANDGIAIAAQFEKHATVLHNKHPFSPEMLKQLNEDGHYLARVLTPKGTAPEQKSNGPTPDQLLRDRLWTEVVARYDDLYQAGVAIWGRRGVDKHIPPLRARAQIKSDKATDAAAPAADQATKPAGG
ncbi:MAG: hypothetical protein U0441_07855 [Polyangiaceae bacterium]